MKNNIWCHGPHHADKAEVHQTKDGHMMGLLLNVQGLILQIKAWWSHILSTRDAL